MISWVTSINDIIRAIRENPEARDELRRVLLTDELLAMPQRLSDLVRWWMLRGSVCRTWSRWWMHKGSSCRT